MYTLALASPPGDRYIYILKFIMTKKGGLSHEALHTRGDGSKASRQDRKGRGEAREVHRQRKGCGTARRTQHHPPHTGLPLRRSGDRGGLVPPLRCR